MPRVDSTPLLSFIVLSYNYEKYIGQTIQSILDQTIQDFEIIVVDDASKDGSCAVVKGFNDPRIRLFRNDMNLGGARSYNRAVQMAQGEWLVNLDADDWIAPNKLGIQLAASAANPDVQIIGTHVSFVDDQGHPHPNSAALDEYTNRNWDPNLVENWIGHNRLCRSSTIVKRNAHLDIGLDDPDMVRAPDYELWTRALREGCRFLVVPEKLTTARIHSRGVTHGNTLESFVERAWVGLHNLRPHIERLSAWPSFEQLLETVATDANISSLDAKRRYRLLASFVLDIDCRSFSEFERFLEKSDTEIENIGKRMFVLASSSANKSRAEIERYVEARDFWHKIATQPLWQRLLRKISPIKSRVKL